MQLIDQHRKSDIAGLHALGQKCLSHVQDLYPSSWQTIIRQNYQSRIEILMVAKAIEAWDAAIMLYNQEKTAAEKIWFMAAVKNMANEKLETT